MYLCQNMAKKLKPRKKIYYPQLSDETKFLQQVENNEKAISSLQSQVSIVSSTVGTTFWFQMTGEYDYTQPTYYYIGGLDGTVHRVNRYTKGNSSVKAQAVGTWVDRLILTYI